LPEAAPRDAPGLRPIIGRASYAGRRPTRRVDARIILPGLRTLLAGTRRTTGRGFAHHLPGGAISLFAASSRCVVRNPYDGSKTSAQIAGRKTTIKDRHRECFIRRMNQITSFRDLDAWQLSMDLVDQVMATTRRLPKVEFDLRRQLNRAAISIPSNVAEGWRRTRRRGAYQNHVSIAMGSHAELDTQLEICFRNGLLDPSTCKTLLTLLSRVGPVLSRLHDALD
jgi:four helix bundle protein